MCSSAGNVGLKFCTRLTHHLDFCKLRLSLSLRFEKLQLFRVSSWSKRSNVARNWHPFIPLLTLSILLGFFWLPYDFRQLPVMTLRSFSWAASHKRSIFPPLHYFTFFYAEVHLPTYSVLWGLAQTSSPLVLHYHQQTWRCHCGPPSLGQHEA